MKAIIISIALVIYGLNVLAANPTKTDTQSGTNKNTSTFSTKTMKASVTYDNANMVTLDLSKTDNQKVKISIVKNGITIFSDSYKNVLELSKGYDISELPKGKYTILIVQGDQKFEKQIEKTFDGAIEFEQ
ncbi:MAG: hypothetical protein V4643_06015 [Bacteroidota bacterium]